MSDQTKKEETPEEAPTSGAILPARELLAEKAEEYGYTEQFIRGSSDYVIAATSPSSYELIIARQRRVERLTMGGVGVFVVCLIAAYIMTDGRVMTDPASVLRSIQSVGSTYSAEGNCDDPRFQQSTKCQEQRSQKEADWRNMSRFDSGKTNPFAVHGRE